MGVNVSVSVGVIMGVIVSVSDRALVVVNPGKRTNMDVA